MEEKTPIERNYFNVFEEMIQENGRPQNIKTLMNHGFKYYFKKPNFYFSDIVIGGKCSKNEDTNKLYCGYFFFENGILKRKHLRQYRQKGTKESEEDYKKSTEEFIKNEIAYPSYNIYVDIFFNFELNKTYDPTTDKNYLLEYIKEYLIKFFNDQLKDNKFTDNQKALFKGYLHKFNTELAEADINKINTFIDFLFNTPLLDSFVINSTTPTPTNDIEQYLKQTLKEFEDHETELKDKIKSIDSLLKKVIDVSTQKEREEIDSIYNYVIHRTNVLSTEKLTEEEINLTNIEDSKLSPKDRVKKYSILRVNYINTLFYYQQRTENYKEFTPTEEHKQLFRVIFTYSLNDIVLKGQDSVNQALSLLMTNCGKPQISESDLMLYIDSESLNETEKNNLEHRIKNSNKEDLKKIAKWKILEQRAISLKNELKALERDFKQATKEDQDTSEIIEKIETVKSDLAETEAQERNAHLNIILYNKNYYINKGKTDIIQNDVESGKIEISTPDKSVIILTDTKTAVNENEETYYILQWIKCKAQNSKSREFTIPYKELNEILFRLNYIDSLTETNERKLKYARSLFYTQCEYLQGKTLKHAIYNENGKKLLSTDKGVESIISIRKQGYAYVITLNAFLYELFKIEKKYLAIPSKTFEYSYQTTNFLLTTRSIREANPLKQDPNSYTIEEIIQNQPYNTFVSREDYKGKDYERDVLKQVKDQMNAVINDKAGTFSKDPKELKENEHFNFIESNESEKHKEHLAKNREKALKNIKKTKKSKQKTKKTKKK